MLNSAVSACGAGRQWEAALRLVAPAVAARTAMFEQLAVQSLGGAQRHGGESTSDAAATPPVTPATGSRMPLWQLGSRVEPDGAAGGAARLPLVDGETFATLVSTLEACGRPAEAQAALQSATASEREHVLASYVALLQVWSSAHEKKASRRF
jgi:hypothetical protein